MMVILEKMQQEEMYKHEQPHNETSSILWVSASSTQYTAAAMPQSSWAHARARKICCPAVRAL